MLRRCAIIIAPVLVCMYVCYWYSILYYTKLYYTILWYTVPCCTTTYCYSAVLLYYTVLYYTILYYTILYYTILYYTNTYTRIQVYTSSFSLTVLVFPKAVLSPITFWRRAVSCMQDKENAASIYFTNYYDPSIPKRYY
jgi:hypothetical protein